MKNDILKDTTEHAANQTTPKNFALIGASGYVAPRHMKAIKDTGNKLIAALDPSDSVGILDSFAYDVAFFTEFERFDRHAEKLRRQGPDKAFHYVTICSPNYLHDAHIRFALRSGADAICEKPIVLNPWNLDALAEIEKETGHRIYNILQLRVHQSIISLRNKVAKEQKEKKHEIELAYITSRGSWYFTSWKGDLSKSGGIASNIGIHFFDMLMWIFGRVKYHEVHVSEHNKMAGYMELEKANVRWLLSVDNRDLPHEVRAKGIPTFRSITVDGEEFEFSKGFTDLHTVVYQGILDGQGFGLDEARPSIELVYQLRNSKAALVNREHGHPFLRDV